MGQQIKKAQTGLTLEQEEQEEEREDMVSKEGWRDRTAAALFSFLFLTKLDFKPTLIGAFESLSCSHTAENYSLECLTVEKSEEVCPLRRSRKAHSVHV